MRVSAIVSQLDGRWLAQCEEVDLSGEGGSADEALACLREALEEYFHAEAVAPPAQPPRESIEIVVVDSP